MPPWRRSEAGCGSSAEGMVARGGECGVLEPVLGCYTAGASAGSMHPATRLRPPFLAAYNAASAASIQARRLLWRGAAGATPVLLGVGAPGRARPATPFGLLADAVGNGRRVLGEHARQHDGKFIAAVAPRAVARAHVAAHHMGQRAG